MALMRRRAEEIGAHIEYRPTTGGGTAVVVRVGRHDFADSERGPSGVPAVRVAP
jgi:nitrate/nitrite-specific signal transduction histidine kinase